MDAIKKSKLTTILREIVGRLEDPATRDSNRKPSTYELEQAAARAKEGLEILKSEPD
jgi:hypothetical protein